MTRFGCVWFSVYACGFSAPQMLQFCLFAYPPWSKWASSEKMIFFLLKSASSVSRSQAHLAKQKGIGWSIYFNFWINWTLCGVIPKFVMQNSSQWCPRYTIIDNDCELMLMALHTHFLSLQQYSRVYALFLVFHALVYRWWWLCQFLSLFSQDNEHTELKSILFFQNPYAIIAHTFCIITMIFKVIPQYFPALFKRIHNQYSFSGRIKLIIWQIRRDLSATIHEISNSWKKVLDGGPNIYTSL